MKFNSNNDFMKHATIFFLAVSLLYKISPSSVAQCTIIPNATPSLTLTHTVGVNNATGVAFNPNLNLYYIAQAGNPGFPLETFDVAGTWLFQTNTGFDMRGLWWNSITNQLESNGYNTGGIWAYDLNGSGYGLNTGTSVFTGLNQPTSQSVGDYNCVDDEIWYYNAGAIMKRDRASNALIGTFPITGLPVGTANLNNNTVFYTDCLGHEIGLLDYTLKRVYFIDKTTMAYTGMSQLPAGAVTSNAFKASWANGRVWLLDSGPDIWYSYQVLTGFNTNCTVVVCTPPILIIDDLTVCSPNTVDLNNAINAASGAGNASFYNTLVDANAPSNPIGNVVGASGTYYIRLEDVGDPTCFTVLPVTVTINPVYNIIENITACENATVNYPDGTNEIITANTSHNSNLLTIQGCDSIVVTNVTMTPTVNSSENIDICSGADYTFPDGTLHTNIIVNESYISTLLTVGGCDSLVTTNININPLYNTVSNINACENTLVTYPDATTEIITGNTVQTSILTSISGCDSTIVTNVTMDLLPDAGTSGTAVFCPGGPTGDLFNSIGGTPNAIGTWSPALASGTGIFDPSIDVPTTYVYSVTNPCGTSSSNVVVTFTTSPDPGLNGSVSFCSSDPTYDLFTALGGTPETGGVWVPALTSGTGLFNPSADPGGIYSYEITSACGVFSAQVNVTINPSDDATFNYPTAVYCITDPNPIATITGLPGGTFTISGGGVIDLTTGEIDILASGAGGFGVTYTTNGPCPSVFVYDISIVPIADASIAQAGPFCEDDQPYNLQATNPGGTWSGPGVDPVTGVFDPMLANAGTNTITYTISGSCGDAQSIQIEVTPIPIVTTIADTTIIAGNPVGLITTGTGGNYTWTPSIWLDCDDCESPIATPEDMVTYTVTLEENGCTASAQVTITVIYEPVIFVPNIFSPNGDNNNDILYVRGKAIESLTFIVYDRWGEKVFESTSLDEGWDGTFRGKKMNPAVFVYFVEYTFKGIDQEAQILKGDVTLIR